LSDNPTNRESVPSGEEAVRIMGSLRGANHFSDIDATCSALDGLKPSAIQLIRIDSIPKATARTGMKSTAFVTMQHLLGVYSLEFEILEFFLDVDSSAARPGRAALE
jgi:hypothetical protein